MFPHSPLPPNDAKDEAIAAWIDRELDRGDSRVRTWKHRVLGKTVAQILAERQVNKKHLSLAVPVDAYGVFMAETRKAGMKPGAVLRMLAGQWLRERGSGHIWFDTQGRMAESDQK